MVFLTAFSRSLCPFKMSDLIIYKQCPACKSAAISKVFTCKDHTVTQQVFEVWKCSSCTLRFTQSVPDASHIAPYYQSADYVSHSDTKKGLVNRVYHLVRNYTLGVKRTLIKKVTGKPTGALLDIGAGTGAFAHTMQKAGWQVTGLEPDEIARANALSNYQLSLDTLEKLPSLPSSSYDVITMWHVLEHVHDLHGYLRIMHNILKADATLVIAVPNYTSYDATVYDNCWAAYDVPRHLYHFSPKSMEVLLQAHGFRLEQMKPMWFDSFYVSMLSEKYRGNHGNIFRAFWNGLISNIKTMSDTKCCSSVIYIIKKS